MSRCESCGVEIVWVTTNAGESMPMDMKREIIMVVDTQATGGRPAIWKPVTGHKSHFATCPNASAHRKRP